MVLPSRFWSKVNITSECWLWIGTTIKDGYGKFSWGGNSVYAHRLLWESINGTIPKNMYICHTCDVRNCVKPSHIYLGTPIENAKDMIDRNRTKYIGKRGESNPRSKITYSQVLEIRASSLSCSKLGKMYNISAAQISGIKRKLYWK